MNSNEFMEAMDRYVGVSKEPFTDQDVKILREGVISIFDMTPEDNGKFSERQNQLIDQKLIEFKNFLNEYFKGQ